MKVWHLLSHTSDEPPGTRYRYDGNAFGRLTQVIERATSQLFARELANRIIHPLGLTQTGPNPGDPHAFWSVVASVDVSGDDVARARAEFAASGVERRQIESALAQGYARSWGRWIWPSGLFGPMRPIPHGFTLSATSGLAASAPDVARFSIALDEGRLLGEAMRVRAWTAPLASDGRPLPYALGWFVQEHRGDNLVWHYGHGLESSSLIVKIPERRVTFVILANSDGLSRGVVSATTRTSPNRPRRRCSCAGTRVASCVDRNGSVSRTAKREMAYSSGREGLSRIARQRTRGATMRLAVLTALVGVIITASSVSTQTPSVPQPNSVFLEDLTWMEVRDAIAGGKTTVIVPTGGTEQNGPHMALGKHNYLVAYKAGQIAKQLGNALVAPVVSYVPEGDINPPTGHMRFAGTISLPQDVFVKVLEHAARSLRQHGFVDVAFIGDSGGNQAGQKLAADALNKEWAGTPRACASHHRLLSGTGRRMGRQPGRERRRRRLARRHARHIEPHVPQSVDVAIRQDGARTIRRWPRPRRESCESDGAVRQTHSRDASR